MNSHITSAAKARRHGTTLLEVLIAVGILVIGLSSVAALLPAAGSILGEALNTDRSATLITNTFADLEFRRTLQASDFNALQGGQRVTTVVMGDVFEAPAIATYYNSTQRKRLTKTAKAGVDTNAYGRAWYIMTATPASPLPAGTSYTAGMPTRVTVVVTRNELAASDNDTAAPRLLRVSPGVYRIFPPGANPTITGVNQTLTPAQTAIVEGTRKMFLQPCSWVVVNPGNVPRWFQVGSSWVTYATGVDGEVGAVSRSYVSFVDSAGVTAVENASQVIGVRGFVDIVRTEERILPMN